MVDNFDKVMDLNPSLYRLHIKTYGFFQQCDWPQTFQNNVEDQGQDHSTLEAVLRCRRLDNWDGCGRLKR